MVFRWVITIVLALISAALMAGPNFQNFLIYLAGILLLGLALRENEKAKKLRGEKRPDSE